MKTTFKHFSEAKINLAGNSPKHHQKSQNDRKNGLKMVQKWPKKPQNDAKTTPNRPQNDAKTMPK